MHRHESFNLCRMYLSLRMRELVYLVTGCLYRTAFMDADVSTRRGDNRFIRLEKSRARYKVGLRASGDKMHLALWALTYLKDPLTRSY
jgi:hypothetical protein